MHVRDVLENRHPIDPGVGALAGPFLAIVQLPATENVRQGMLRHLEEELVRSIGSSFITSFKFFCFSPFILVLIPGGRTLIGVA